MSWSPRQDYWRGPVAIIGGGVLGRRLAIMWGSRGGSVHLCERIPSVRLEAATYYQEYAATVAQPGYAPGRLLTFEDVEQAVKTAWLIIECVPEKLPLKIELLGELDRLADADAIIASNSSSFRSSEMVTKVSNKARVLNIHAFSPPENLPCEIMTCGHTDPAILDFAMLTCREHGFSPFRVKAESSGFIYNRVWAAIKRESLYAVAQGAADVEDLDALFKARLKTAKGPFQMMDDVGLDVVLDIEEHYAQERGGLPAEPRILLREYVEQGHLGRKSGRGFYNYSSE